jgi:hypothetical protein
MKVSFSLLVCAFLGVGLVATAQDKSQKKQTKTVIEQDGSDFPPPPPPPKEKRIAKKLSTPPPPPPPKIEVRPMKATGTPPPPPPPRQARPGSKSKQKTNPVNIPLA